MRSPYAERFLVGPGPDVADLKQWSSTSGRVSRWPLVVSTLFCGQLSADRRVGWMHHHARWHVWAVHRLKRCALMVVGRSKCLASAGRRLRARAQVARSQHFALVGWRPRHRA